MKDQFFTQSTCDRCGADIIARIMSWFTKETLCMECCRKEDEIKKALSKDNKGSMEGCGFVPQKGRDFQNNPELLEKT
jgi:hypothetical protein